MMNQPSTETATVYMPSSMMGLLRTEDYEEASQTPLFLETCKLKVMLMQYRSAQKLILARQCSDRI